MLADRTTRAPDVADARWAADGRRRFVAHAAALLVVLLAAVVWIDNGASAITDEGAVVAQVAAADEGNWSLPRPFAVDDPSFDPTGRFAPMELSVIGDGTFIPYGKHPAYPAFLVPFWAVGGHLGLLVASAVGTWAAAISGALLTRHLAGRTEHTILGRRIRPDILTLWFLGVASPMVFDATVVMAHGIGAAFAGFTVLSALRCLGAPDSRAALRWGGSAVVLGAGAVLVRSEGLLVVGALAATLGVLGLQAWRRRSDPGIDHGDVPNHTGAPDPVPVRSPRPLVLGVALAVSGAATYVLDGRLAALVTGSDGVSAFSTTQDGYDLVDGRAQALWASVIRPGTSSMGSPALLAGIGVLCVLTGAVLLRTRGSSARTVVAALAVAGAACYLLRHAARPAVITGLIPAAPVLLFGLLQLRGPDVRSLAARVCAATAAITAAAIWMTSYAIGGALEWGGRFYHVVLPLLAPLAALGLGRALAALPTARATRVLVAALVVTPLALSVLWVRTDVEMRHGVARIVTTTVDAARAARPPADGGDPVVLSDPRGLGRMMWAHLDEVRFLRVEVAGQLADALAALDTSGVDTVTLALSPQIDLEPVLGDSWSVDREHPAGAPSWRLLELHRT